jgi:diguanylate cyclase (GGDEF)-like protein/PAS domain S-box-containing protein
VSLCQEFAQPDGGAAAAADFYEQLVDMAPDAMLVVDGEGVVTLANRQCESLLGWKPAELVGQPLSVLLPPDAREVHDRNRPSRLAGPHRRSMGSGMAFTAIRADGTEVPVDISLSPIQTPNGTVVAAAIRPATAIREVEHALHDSVCEEAIAALRRATGRFQASIEHLQEALSVFTAIRDETGAITDFRWEFANVAASSITGYAPADLEGRTLMEVLPDHGPSGMLDVYRAVVETGEPYVDPSLSYEDVWGDGRRVRRVFDVRATKLDDGFVVVTREVTEQRAQQEELARQRSALEQANTEMKLRNNLADMLQSCLTFDEAYSVTTQACGDLFTGYSGSLSVMHPSRDVVELKGIWGTTAAGGRIFAPNDCWALRRGRPHVSGPASPRCTHLPESAAITLCVPMVAQSEMTGLFQVTAPLAGPDDNLETSSAGQLAITIAAQLSMAFANLRLRDSLREMAIRDPLTGLYNRRFMEETLNRELSLATRNNTEVALVAIDIDHFKRFNDTHGHDAGDAVMEAVGDVLSRHLRSSDVACRFGGEEFVVILPDCSLDNAQERAEDLRRHVSSLRIPHGRIELPGPTISCGVACFPHHGTTPQLLMSTADAALYAAKEGGRDKVVAAPPDLTILDGHL